MKALAEIALGFALLAIPAAVVIASGNEIAGEARVIDVVRSILHHGKKKGPTAWVRKAIVEQQKGHLVVLVYPVDKWILMLLSAIGTEVRNLGDVRWLSIEDGRPGKGTGRHIACFVLRPQEHR